MDRFQAIVAALRAQGRAEASSPPPTLPKPFITISRQAGAGGHTIMEKLVAKLRQIDPADPPWTGFDKELVELAIGDDEILRPLVEALEYETRTWLEDVLATMVTDRNLNEYAAYKRTAQVIRALIQHGRVIIVGRGGVFLSRNRPGGTHIYLVAPEEERIEHMAKLHDQSKDKAAEQVRRIDQNRQTFYNRYWHDAEVRPETFTVTFNTAVTSDDQIVDSVIPLVEGIQGRPVRRTPVGVGV